MRRVISALVVGLVIFLTACKSRPKAGDLCAGPDMGHGACIDPAHALSCRAFTWRLDACRGPAACTPQGEAVHCDQRVADEGDSCGDDARACSADGTKLLQCDGARMTAVRSCRGPRGCHHDEGEPACDQGAAEIGDPCDADGSHCASDGHAILRCAPSHHYVLERACPGARGCFRGEKDLVCDVSLGDVGATCTGEGGAWCSRDGKQENTCHAGSLVKEQTCRTRCGVEWSADGRGYRVICD